MKEYLMVMENPTVIETVNAANRILRRRTAERYEVPLCDKKIQRKNYSAGRL